MAAEIGFGPSRERGREGNGGAASPGRTALRPNSLITGKIQGILPKTVASRWVWPSLSEDFKSLSLKSLQTYQGILGGPMSSVGFVFCGALLV